MSSPKKLACKVTLRQVFICLMPRTLPPPLTHCIRVYSIFIHKGKVGGGELNQREEGRGNSSQSWIENTNITDCTSSLHTLINTCRKVPLQVSFFR
jgi:hypothetical protein